MALDPVDRKILALLQRNARESNAEIARQLGMAPSAIFERIRKLEERGVIQGYEARIEPKAVGLGLVAFIFVRSSDRWDNLVAGKRLAKIPEVQEVHNIAGEDCYLVKVRVKDTDALRQVLQEKIGRIETVVQTKTTIVLGTAKETGHLPVEVAQERVVDV